MTNAEIERLLTTITKTVNTLSTVVCNIDELLGMAHVFTVNRSETLCEYLWGDDNTNIELSITIFIDGLVLVGYRHPLLPEGSRGLITSLDAPDLNQALLHHVGSCCHKSPTV